MASRPYLFLLKIIFLLIVGISVTKTQDLAKIGNQNPLGFSGGISGNQIFYSSAELENRRDPDNYYLGGPLTLDIYGLSLPIFI
jgi:hypothetical protein